MDETRIQSKTGLKRMVKIAIALAILITIGCAGSYAYNKIEWYPVLIATISTGVNESDGSPIVTNVTFEQSRVIYKGTDAVVDYPDISMMVRNGSLLAPPITYWAAIPWNQEESSGKYTVTAVFREGYIPSSGDLLILTIRQTGLRGYIMSKKTAFYIWK